MNIEGDKKTRVFGPSSEVVISWSAIYKRDVLR